MTYSNKIRDRRETETAEILHRAIRFAGSQRAVARNLLVAANTVNRWTRHPGAVPGWALLEMMHTNEADGRRYQCPNCKIPMRATAETHGDTCQRCGYRLHLPRKS